MRNHTFFSTVNALPSESGSWVCCLIQTVACMILGSLGCIGGSAYIFVDPASKGLVGVSQTNFCLWRLFGIEIVPQGHLGVENETRSSSATGSLLSRIDPNHRWSILIPVHL
jgi:hypothetical protein